MENLIRTSATITGSIHVVSEGPIFRCIFPMVAHGDSLLGGLVGDLGKRVVGYIKAGDKVFLTGKFIQEKTFGKVFVVMYITMDESTKDRHNIQTYA